METVCLLHAPKPETNARTALKTDGSCAQNGTMLFCWLTLGFRKLEGRLPAYSLESPVWGLPIVEADGCQVNGHMLRQRLVRQRSD